MCRQSASTCWSTVMLWDNEKVNWVWSTEVLHSVLCPIIV